MARGKKGVNPFAEGGDEKGDEWRKGGKRKKGKRKISGRR
jgi:hypothetical protein